jgi:hypothetical protein
MRLSTWKCVAIVLAASAFTLLVAPRALQAAEQGDAVAPGWGRATATPVGRGAAAMAASANANKYLFIFFWNNQDQATSAMYRVFQTATAKTADRADALAIHTGDAAEQGIVARFGVSRAPMPLVLAIAPNGAVTRGFPGRLADGQLQQAFVSPATATCMKALQDRKLVLLCVQNGTTQSNEAAMQGVQDLKADPQYARVAEVIALDPNDSAEAGFLKNLQVDPRTPVAVTAVLTPPGSVVAKFEGPVSKDAIVAKLATASSGGCPGGKCGPGGCGPKR